MLENLIKEYLKNNNFHRFEVKAVLFDMDGVLYDSMRNHSRAWVKAMNESGLPFTEYQAYLNEGRTGTATVNSVFVTLNGREATEDEKQSIYALKSKYFEELGKIEKMPFAYNLLQKLKLEGYKIMVVTGSAQPTLIDSLTKNFPHIFTKNNIVSALDVKHGKPDPAPYLKALDKLGIQPWEAVVIENAPMGVQASAAAKIFTIGVNTGPLKREDLLENGANLVLDSMQELFDKWDDFQLNKPIITT